MNLVSTSVIFLIVNLRSASQVFGSSDQDEEDSDTNGKATFSEFTEYSKLMRQRISSGDVGAILEEVDRDRNGLLSLEEVLRDMDLHPPNNELSSMDAQSQK